VKGDALDAQEPSKLAMAVRKWGLKYVVITSVDRGDLPDQGAGHFAACIREVKKQNPGVLVEVLIPDFRANAQCIKTIVDARPDVIAHNIETTEALQSKVRDPRAGYRQSIKVLEIVKELDCNIFTKSAIMLGLGETDEGILKALDGLRAAGCDFITVGQYMRPSKKHLPIVEYASLERFKWIEQKALEKGFLYAACGPFVRSSYKAGELFATSIRESSKNKREENNSPQPGAAPTAIGRVLPAATGL
jgi:lipoic acid synthetase